MTALTANYTDSEEEASGSEGEREPSPSGSAPNRTIAAIKGSPTGSGSSVKSTPSKRTRLVSYGADEADKSLEQDPDEAEDDKNEPVDMDLDTEDDPETEAQREAPPHVEAWTEGVSLPPEPPGSCSPSLQEDINRLYQRKKETGYDMNAAIQGRKAFRNPSIYEKLIQFCNIDEHGTNFPKDLYDGHLFGPESYYDELAKAQKIDMEKREKAAKERQKVTEAPKRKSKWDQVGPSQGAASVASATLPTLRTATSSTKSIPAFGMLKKH